MPQDRKVVANPSTVFREEFDDWALLFNPETGYVYGLNPVGTFIRKQMDGTRSARDFVDLVRNTFDDVSPDAEHEIVEFIDELVNKGFAEYKES